MLGKRIRSLQKALVKEHDQRYIAPYVGHVEAFDKLYVTLYCFINKLEEHFFRKGKVLTNEMKSTETKQHINPFLL